MSFLNSASSGLASRPTLTLLGNRLGEDAVRRFRGSPRHRVHISSAAGQCHRGINGTSMT